MYAISHFAAAAGHRAAIFPRSHRVLLRHWGFSLQEAAGLLPDLPDLGGRLTWTIDERSRPRPDLVVHLVDATRLSGVFGGASWNAMGPVEAMHRAWKRGASELALVLGSTRHLPERRHGCWILSGGNSLAGALQILVCTTIAPMLQAPVEQPWTVHELAATNSLCTVAKESAPDQDALARRITAAVSGALHLSYATPARVVVAAESRVMDYVVSLNPVMRERMRLCRRPPCPTDLSAEILVAYPWPTALAEVSRF